MKASPLLAEFIVPYLYGTEHRLYPRGSLYPLSPDHPTMCRGITTSHFRACSACPPHSQAGLCRCTLRTISIRTEPTLELLRYSFAGYHPSKTAHQARSPNPYSGSVGKSRLLFREVFHRSEERRVGKEC